MFTGHIDRKPVFENGRFSVQVSYMHDSRPEFSFSEVLRTDVLREGWPHDVIRQRESQLNASDLALLDAIKIGPRENAPAPEEEKAPTDQQVKDAEQLQIIAAAKRARLVKLLAEADPAFAAALEDDPTIAEKVF